MNIGGVGTVLGDSENIIAILLLKERLAGAKAHVTDNFTILNLRICRNDPGFCSDT